MTARRYGPPEPMGTPSEDSDAPSDRPGRHDDWIPPLLIQINERVGVLEKSTDRLQSKVEAVEKQIDRARTALIVSATIVAGLLALVAWMINTAISVLAGG